MLKDEFEEKKLEKEKKNSSQLNLHIKPVV
jgi:hypothetical protein